MMQTKTAGRVDELIAGSVLQHRGKLALEVDGTAWTYQELWHESDRIASEISAAASHSARIGLDATRSPAMYAGYLAILRLGAAVVPLSPDHPKTRRSAILEAARLDAILVDGQVLQLTPAERATPEDFAYVLFTSGSTGRPKGVPISHGNVLSYLGYTLERYQLGPGCRMSQNFELTFDPSVFDLLACWASGATLVPPVGREALTPVGYASRRSLTHWFSVPSAVSSARRFRMLTENAMPGIVQSLFIGEPLTFGHAEAWAAAAPQSTLENVYGPTELTVACAEYRLPAERSDWPQTRNGTVPIGSVFPHLESMIVDSAGTSAEEGELWVRGPQAFRGYLEASNDAGRLVSAGNERWYRTGDRVCAEDGHLVHVGRMDRQVKVRGYRIELGDVEAAAREVEGVHDAAVIWDADADDGRLRCFLTGEPRAIRALREELAALIPRYMIPDHIEYLSEFPLNSSGKTDYPALKTL